MTASSLLGQGELLRLEPSPGFNGFHSALPKPPSSLVSQSSVDEPNNPTDPSLTLRINLKQSRVIRARYKQKNNTVLVKRN